MPNPSSPAPRKKWAVVLSSSLAVKDHIPAGTPTHPASAGMSLILPAGNNVNSRQQGEEAVLPGRLLLVPTKRRLDRHLLQTQDLFHNILSSLHPHSTARTEGSLKGRGKQNSEVFAFKLHLHYLMVLIRQTFTEDTLHPKHCIRTLISVHHFLLHPQHLNRQISKFTESVQGKKSGAGWGVEITIHKAVFNPFSN